MSSLFAAIELAPRDPILGLTEAFNADPNPAKVNLGVGVYGDEIGKLPLLECVREAEQRLQQAAKPHGYLPIDGLVAYDTAVQALTFSTDCAALSQGRIVTVQTLGGTGGLKIGADFLRRLNPNAKVLISEPSWENHRALFETAGFEVDSYAYYDPALRGVDFAKTLASLEAAEPGTIVLLHACCHNPTGCDLSPAQWADVLKVIQNRQLVPFLDMAYQGFGDGIEQDGAVVQQFADAGLSFVISTSFSKSFSLYGQRVGTLSLVCASQDEARRVQSQVKRVIRTNYSNPPSHGAQVVAMVLTNPELRAMWEQELSAMRLRIRQMREALRTRWADRLQVLRPSPQTTRMDLSFVTQQRGMFSYLGLNVLQMQRLRSEFGIYGTDAGRICVAALNTGNLDAVVAGLAGV
jgi:aromatic-amino-acid transaminase